MSIHQRGTGREHQLARDGSSKAVAGRRTYFLSGFDPRGIAHYQRLFQGELRPAGWSLGRRMSRGLISRWILSPRADPAGGERAPVELCFLHWDDIARAHWPRQPQVLILQALLAARWYLLSGGLIRIGRLCPGVALCGAYPLIWLALAVGSATIALLWLPAPAGWPVAALLLWGCWRAADALGVVWLTRTILFTHRLGEARDGDLRERVGELATALLDLECEDPARHVLLVGHSSGSFVLAMLAAELHRRPEAAPLLRRLELLTLGQNLANLAVYPRARRFREDLQVLADQPRIPWRDVTSRHDLLCFAGVNPFTSCGLPLPAGEPYPRMELLDLRRVRGLRRRDWLGQLFALHFDYLRGDCAAVNLPALLVRADG